jgi:translation initiation factor 1
MDNSRLVYSTEFGRACPECGRPVDECICPRGRAAKSAAGDGEGSDAAPADITGGTIRVRRETKGRGGKTVTTISGVQLQGAALEALASELKRRCGTGGSVKDGVIVIQGDNREKAAAALQAYGYKVKLAGG